MSKDFAFFAVVAWLVSLTVVDIYVKHDAVQSIGRSIGSTSVVEQDLYYKQTSEYWKVTSDNWKTLFDTCNTLRETGR